MHRLAGTAEDVRHTVHVSASGSRTEHLVLFEIAGTRLCFRADAPVAIKDGDDLAVVWEPGDKGFNTVLAFHNRTVDARDHDVHTEGCTGCGCSTFVILPLLLISTWAAVDRDDWFDTVLLLAAAVTLLIVHLMGHRTAQRTAEKLREVDDLLDAEPDPAARQDS
jgi:hypothetical protein